MVADFGDSARAIFFTADIVAFDRTSRFLRFHHRYLGSPRSLLLTRRCVAMHAFVGHVSDRDFPTAKFKDTRTSGTKNKLRIPLPKQMIL